MNETIQPIASNQEAFDRVWQHFVVEKGERSLSPRGQCRYRGSRGERCAAGVLIPDELYDEGMEDHGIIELLQYETDVDTTALQEYWRNVDPYLIGKMQWAHDDSCERFHEEFEGEMRDIAKDFGLVVPEAP